MSPEPVSADAMNANDYAFMVLRDFLNANAASDEMHQALDGLQERYELGKEMNMKRLEAWRKDKKRLAELENR